MIQNLEIPPVANKRKEIEPTKISEADKRKRSYLEEGEERSRAFYESLSPRDRELIFGA